MRDGRTDNSRDQGDRASLREAVAVAERRAQAATETLSALLQQAASARDDLDQALAELRMIAAELDQEEAGDVAPINAHTSEGARLLATQLAASGSSREEIARQLHDSFGIDDADAALASRKEPPPRRRAGFGR